jgi:hypothetical protein
MPTDLKQRIAEMKEAANALRGVKSGCDISHADPRFVDFIMKCAPAHVLALIAEIERQSAEIADYEQTDLVPRTRWEHTNADWLEAREQFATLARKATVEIERLQAEIERLKRGNRIDD